MTSMKLATLLCLPWMLQSNGALADPAQPEPRLTSTVRGEVQPRDERASGDGVYGRFDGDLNLALGLGGEVSSEARGAVLVRALYYHSVGLFAGYADAFDSSASVRRNASFGIELRPLFLLRWSNDLQFGCAVCDLTLDSLSLAAAGVWSQPAQPSGAARSGLEWSLGMGVPLFARAQGLWLEGKLFLRPGLQDDALGGLVVLSYYAPVLSPWVR